MPTTVPTGDLAQTEYAALRATIRERGTARAILFVLSIAAWAALVIALAAIRARPIATLVPLLVLAAAFAAIDALHSGVERIGRFLQVFYEERATAREQPGEGPCWETTAMAYACVFPASGADPLFAWVFAAATALNFMLVLVSRVRPFELIMIAAAHLALLIAIVLARRRAAVQRARDLERFRQIAAERRGAAASRD